MSYEFRELTSKDIFPMFKLISKIGVNEFKACFGNDTVMQAVADGKAAEQVGIEIAFSVVGIIVEKLPTCEDDIYKFLASVSNKNRKDLEQMPIAEFAEMVIAFVQKPEFKDFLQVVTKLFKSEN